MTASQWCKCTVTVKVGALSRSLDLRVCVSGSDTGVKRVSARLISEESSWINGPDYTPLSFCSPCWDNWAAALGSVEQQQVKNKSSKVCFSSFKLGGDEIQAARLWAAPTELGRHGVITCSGRKPQPDGDLKEQERSTEIIILHKRRQ